jgi:hypothetical protein
MARPKRFELVALIGAQGVLLFRSFLLFGLDQGDADFDLRWLRVPATFDQWTDFLEE